MGHPDRGRGRVLGLDPGERWIGVAVSDDDRRLALPLLTIDRRAEADDGVARISERLGGEGASLLVVGVPFRPDGEEDPQARAFRRLGEAIASALDLEVEIVSERFSNPLTTEAPPQPRRRARASAAQRQRRKVEEHALAAANILQRWLDRLPSIPDRSG